MKNNTRKQLTDSMFTLLLGLTAVIIAFLFIKVINKWLPMGGPSGQLSRIESNTEEIKKKITPYEYKDKLSKIEVVKDFHNSTTNTKSSETFTRNFSTQGAFRDGYIYVKAAIDNKPLDNYGDVYIKLSAMFGFRYSEYGGHLIESKSLDTPKSPNYTEMLFKLSDVKYKENYKQSDVEVISADWLKLLNEGSKQRVMGFTSTVYSGHIIEISIYYDCIEGSRCSINIVN